ncbi:uncharacterized protein LOC128247586 isoform X2 [Octopus bimaculoides]|uniref:Uncharacterized protein n=2 Tax=Octopus bimaculoides TaxID=37653 RepID=A0A0L8GM02_OCTBM|nr:uncharacterized protein LOC128247586 isoform X2 [Octopus bimaculoides]XP_052823037.1 uncharacterized protein LOC128247586 isoform X2 [Octopus bimaculoides]
MNRCIKLGIAFMLLYITLANFTTATNFENSGLSTTLSKYKKMTKVLQKRNGGLLDHVLSDRQFLSPHLQSKRINLETRDNGFANAEDDGNKRRGAWYYDYGLGGGRFGKRDYDEYGLGGGRFGRDVDHVDMSDA